MSKISRRACGWLLGVLFLGASCGKDASQMATLQVRLTDAPGDYQEVNIDIQDVQVNSTDTTSAGWKSIGAKKGIYDLLKFTNGLDTLLGTVDLPAGKISQIRLILGTNNSVKIGGQSINLTTPSAQQSGLKININRVLTAGIVSKITLDFDAARSIVASGNNKYILKPVIRIVSPDDTGGIKGTVTPAASTPAVYAIQGADTVGSTFANHSNGKFTITGLPIGSYTVGFAPTAGYKADTVHNVGVTAGKVTDLGTVQINR